MYLFLRTSFLSLWMAASLGACCTKKDCDYVHQPAITVVYKNFVPGTPGPVGVYALNKNNGTPVDSVKLAYFNGAIRLNEGLFGTLEAGTLEDYSYVLTVGSGTGDTIRDVSYQVYSYKVDCNKCVLADGSSTVQDYKDLQYRHGGQLYQDADTLFLNK